MGFVADCKAQNDALEGRWSGDHPMLHLIHCLPDDDKVRGAFLHCNDSMDRDELENRNSLPGGRRLVGN